MTVSIPELVQTILLADGEQEAQAPGGVTVGPVSPKQIKDRAVGIMPVGQPKNERYVPLQRMTVALRCHGASVAEAEAVGRWAYGVLKERRRQVIEQPSTSEKFLVHYVTVSGGPNLVQGPVQDTWETGYTVEALVGLEAAT